MTNPSAELLDILLQFSRDYIMVANEDGEPILFNRAYAEVIQAALGVEMRPGLKPHLLLSDAQAVAFWEGLHRRVLSGEQFSVEVAQEFPGKVFRHFSFSFTPITKDGKVTGFCEQSQEITDRVQMEEALRERERELRESQQVAQVGSYRLDLVRKRWTSSPILDAILGIEADHPRTIESWVSIVHPELRDTMRQYFWDEVIGKQNQFDKEYRIVRASDGADRWVHGLGMLRIDASGVVEGMVGTIRDITEKKAMEDQLRQREKLEAIGQLAGGIAHDFNNQLLTILGSAELLRGDLSPESPLRSHADNIITGARRAADLTGQLLAFSRKGSFAATPVDPHQLVSEVVRVLEHTIDKRISILRRLSASPSTVLGDPSQLQNALLNLALNARDAMPDGGALIFGSELISLTRQGGERLPIPVDPGEYICLSVTDTGIGIDRNIQDRIFDPFFTTKEVGQGTGMGLAAVYGTAKQHRGSVEVESAPGFGSTFRLYLPLASDPLEASLVPEQGPREISGNLSVLLVDDEPGVRRTTAAMLGRIGFRVTACADGAEAVALYRERWREFDVVILDMMMPVLGGRDAFLSMRAINPEIRVLVVSGYGLETEATGLLEQGVKAVLRKPFRLGELYERIRSIVPSSASDSGLVEAPIR